MNASILRKFLSSLAIFSMALVMSACQSATTDDGSTSDGASQQAGGQQIADPDPIEEVAEVAEVAEVEEEVEEYVPPVNPLLSQTIVYFDYDQSNIRSEFREVLAAHADNLANNPSLSVRLEGHADERGSREYNIGLGERRAQAVKQALMLSGVAGGALETISYGEERPMMSGSDETSWSQNRRVEIVYNY